VRALLNFSVATRATRLVADRAMIPSREVALAVVFVMGRVPKMEYDITRQPLLITVRSAVGEFRLAVHVVRSKRVQLGI